MCTEFFQTTVTRSAYTFINVFRSEYKVLVIIKIGGIPKLIGNEIGIQAKHFDCGPLQRVNIMAFCQKGLSYHVKILDSSVVEVDLFYCH